MAEIYDISTRQRVDLPPIVDAPETPDGAWTRDPNFMRPKSVACISGKNCLTSPNYSCDLGELHYLVFDWVEKEWRRECEKCHRAWTQSAYYNWSSDAVGNSGR